MMLNRLQTLLQKYSTWLSTGKPLSTSREIIEICRQLGPDIDTIYAVCYLCTLSVYKNKFLQLDPCNTYFQYCFESSPQPLHLPSLEYLRVAGKALQMPDKCLDQVYPDLLCLICMKLLETV